MGNKMAKRRNVDENLTKPQGLYEHDDIDLKKLRQFILDRKLSPCFPGAEENAIDLEECPICLLNYPSLNRSKCCSKGLCTECFIKMRSPLSSRSVHCPFCKYSPYAVEFRGGLTQEERDLEYAEEQKVIEARIRMLNESQGHENFENSENSENDPNNLEKNNSVHEKKESTDKSNSKSESKSELPKWPKIKFRSSCVHPNQLSLSSSKTHKFFQIIHPSTHPNPSTHHSPNHDVIHNMFWDSSNGRFVQEDGSDSILFPISVSTLRSAHPVESEEWQRDREMMMRRNQAFNESPFGGSNSERVYNHHRPPHSIPHELDFISARATSDSSGSGLFSPFHPNNEVDLDVDELMYMEAVWQSLKDYEAYKAKNASNNSNENENNITSNGEGSSNNSNTIDLHPQPSSTHPSSFHPSPSLSPHPSAIHGSSSSSSIVFDSSNNNINNDTVNGNDDNDDRNTLSNQDKYRARHGKQCVESQSQNGGLLEARGKYGGMDRMKNECLFPYQTYESGLGSSSSSRNAPNHSVGNSHAQINESPREKGAGFNSSIGVERGSGSSSGSGSENGNGLFVNDSTAANGYEGDIPMDFEEQLQMALSLSLAEAEKSKQRFENCGGHGHMPVL